MYIYIYTIYINIYIYNIYIYIYISPRTLSEEGVTDEPVHVAISGRFVCLGWFVFFVGSLCFVPFVCFFCLFRSFVPFVCSICSFCLFHLFHLLGWRRSRWQQISYEENTFYSKRTHSIVRAGAGGNKSHR